MIVHGHRRARGCSDRQRGKEGSIWGNRNKTLRSQEIIQKVTHSAEETIALGRELARQVTPPCLILLEGELGAGKTTLAKGIVAGLGAASEEDVTSPTFTLVHEYGDPVKVCHADLYRIEGARELSSLGIEEMLAQPVTVIVEWGEKFEEEFPAAGFRVRLEHLRDDERRIRVEAISP